MARRLFKCVFSLLLVVIFFTPFTTKAVGGFVIDNFKSEIVLNTDGTLTVTETIVVTFNDKLHGIYRDIPVVYEKPDGSKQYTTVKVNSVSQNNQSVQTEISRVGDYTRIRIGSPDFLVGGEKIYVIRYTVAGVIGSFAEHDELYWNVTGNAWEVPMSQVSASVVLPAGNFTKIACYYGSAGSQSECLQTFSGKQAEFSAPHSLLPGEGLTIVAGFTKGVVPIITVAEPLTPTHPISLLYILFGCVTVIIPGALIFMRIWWLKGRDEYYQRKSLHDPGQTEVIKPLWGAYEPIVPEYESPAGLRPGEIGVLIDERADMKDISATIVDLAIRGYLIIKHIPKQGLLGKDDYELVRTKKSSIDVLEYESCLLDKIFKDEESVKISDFRDKRTGSYLYSRAEEFQQDLEEVKNKLYAVVTEKKLFKRNPEKIRRFYFAIGVGMLGAGIIFGGVPIISKLVYAEEIGGTIFSWYLAGLTIGIMIAGIVLCFLAKLMPKRTAFGRDVYRQALGYKLFVSGTEKYRQPFFEKEHVLMEVLPYAMIFGVTKQLAQAMKEMAVVPRNDWYVASDMSMYALITSLNDFSSSFVSVTAATVSGGSGFGGSVGGGFGGGGGGGW